MWTPSQSRSDGSREDSRLRLLESESVLTDGTTAKGRAYKGLLSAFAHNQQIYGYEYNWASQVITIDVEISFDFGPDEHPIGIVRMRRMLNNQYRVAFDDMSTPYSGSPPTSFFGNGMQPSFDSPEKERQFQVRKFLWDSVQPVDLAYGDRRQAQILFDLPVDEIKTLRRQWRDGCVPRGSCR